MGLVAWIKMDDDDDDDDNSVNLCADFRETVTKIKRKWLEHARKRDVEQVL